MRTLSRASVLAFSLLAAPLAAQAVDFSETVTFGDSLTDNRPILASPASLYGNDPMQAVFDKGRRPGDTLSNFAVYRAPSNAMIQQITNYAPQYFGGRRATAISFQIGANDIIQNYGLLAANPPLTNPAADAVVDNLITNIANDFVLLWLAHPTATFVLWTVPDVTHAPRYWSLRGTQGAANVRAHVARINSLLRPLGAVPNITILDIIQMRALSLMPPTVGGQQLIGPPVTGRHDALFADIVHPTAVSNALLANDIINALNARRGISIATYSDSELAALARIP